MVNHNHNEFLDFLEHDNQTYKIWSLNKLAKRFGIDLNRVPYSIKIVLEAVLRSTSQGFLSLNELEEKVQAVMNETKGISIPFMPARVLMQDFTGVPAVVDLATMREAVKSLGGDPKIVEPVIPTDVTVDHSIVANVSGSTEALAINSKIEYQQNKERFKLLRWAEQAFSKLRVFPPGTGIVHQINLEYLASVVQIQEEDGVKTLFPDSVCGTDSHTTMINGLGVLGWGVGGIEAESAMLGYPLMILSPIITGVKLTGQLRPGVTTTDLVLTLTERLRREDVVGHLLEFCGEGVSALNLNDRSTIANMAPEYGATCAYFPVDSETIRYLRATGRPDSMIRLIERYYRHQGMFRKSDEKPFFNRLIEFNLSEVVPCVAGPSRPQDRVPLHHLPYTFKNLLSNNSSENRAEGITVELNGKEVTINNGSILIAAITSCTNTANPTVMIAAGLLARNAVKRGLKVPFFVKTSLSPGSKVVTEYLSSSGLIKPLEALGFHITGYGCMTCSGNSGPVNEQLAKAVKDHDLITCSVLSGNRNFEGRIHPVLRANYLASPPLVIAYAIAGTVCIDLENEPIGLDQCGTPVYLHEIWPSDQDISEIAEKSISPDIFLNHYKHGSLIDKEYWKGISSSYSDLYDWDEESSYIKKAPYFDNFNYDNLMQNSITSGRVLAVLEDSITTDHISPGGVIHPQTPAGKYLTESNVRPVDFNVFGSRRGNHEVMMRGTFGNIHLKNMMVPNQKGGVTVHHPTGKEMTIYEAAMNYKAENTPLIILAGKEYGSGSSRDWAAKGPSLLGVKVIIAESFERIHRSNLICMGILPMKFLKGESWRLLGLDGSERYEINGIEQLEIGQTLTVTATKEDHSTISFQVRACIESIDELAYYQRGGILPLVISNLMHSKKVAMI